MTDGDTGDGVDGAAASRETGAPLRPARPWHEPGAQTPERGERPAPDRSRPLTSAPRAYPSAIPSAPTSDRAANHPPEPGELRRSGPARPDRVGPAATEPDQRRLPHDWPTPADADETLEPVRPWRRAAAAESAAQQPVAEVGDRRPVVGPGNLVTPDRRAETDEERRRRFARQHAAADAGRLAGPPTYLPDPAVYEPIPEDDVAPARRRLRLGRRSRDQRDEPVTAPPGVEPPAETAAVVPVPSPPPAVAPAVTPPVPADPDPLADVDSIADPGPAADAGMTADAMTADADVTAEPAAPAGPREDAAAGSVARATRWLLERSPEPDVPDQGEPPSEAAAASDPAATTEPAEPQDSSVATEPVAEPVEATASARRRFGFRRRPMEDERVEPFFPPEPDAIPTAVTPEPVHSESVVAPAPEPAQPLVLDLPPVAELDPVPLPAASEVPAVPVSRNRPRPRPRPPAAPPSRPAADTHPPAAAVPAAAAAPRRRPRPRPSGAPAAATSGTETASEADQAGSTAAYRTPDISRFLAATEEQHQAQLADDAPDRSAARRRRLAAIGRRLRSRGARTLLIVLVVGAIAAIVLRTYVVGSYYIPSPSMEPTLRGGGGTNDRILVDKISYRVHDPHTGDIVVFSRPSNWAVSDATLVKRIIGLPGDRVALRDGQVFVNGLRLSEPYVNTKGCGPNPTRPFTATTQWTVPLGDYFVMGDNRCDSDDSRHYGPIPRSTIVGRVFLIIWPLSRFGTP